VAAGIARYEKPEHVVFVAEVLKTALKYYLDTQDGVRYIDTHKKQIFFK
jgi:hypothetical protein